MLNTLPASAFLATLIGAVHTYLLIWVWAYIGIYTPLPHWLISQGITGAAFHSALFPADLLTNMLLCVPAAYLLLRLRPRRLWLYLLLAVAPGFLWQYRLFLGDVTLFQDWRMYLSGALLAAFPLPATALIMRRVARWGTLNRSFKPKPLRGSA